MLQITCKVQLTSLKPFSGLTASLLSWVSCRHSVLIYHWLWHCHQQGHEASHERSVIISKSQNEENAYLTCNPKLLKNVDNIAANWISGVASNSWLECKKMTLDKPVIGLVQCIVDIMNSKGTVGMPTFCWPAIPWCSYPPINPLATTNGEHKIISSWQLNHVLKVSWCQFHLVSLLLHQQLQPSSTYGVYCGQWGSDWYRSEVNTNICDQQIRMAVNEVSESRRLATSIWVTHQVTVDNKLKKVFLKSSFYHFGGFSWFCQEFLDTILFCRSMKIIINLASS